MLRSAADPSFSNNYQRWISTDLAVKQHTLLPHVFFNKYDKE